jgi:carbon storage regulator
MLVISRKRGERVVIPGCSLTIAVVAVKGNSVRLGIAAPAELAVLREELLPRKKAGVAIGAKSSTPAAGR